MGIRQEFESLGSNIKADETRLNSAAGRRDMGSMAIVYYLFPTKLGSVLTGSTMYLFNRLTGEPPEELAKISKFLIHHFSEHPNSPIDW